MKSAMSRLACPQAPGVPLHLVQRARSGASYFRVAGDARAYLCALAAGARECACAVHAYVLMGNHVHLLLTPAHHDGATRLMSALADGCSRARGAREKSFDASPVYAPRYLLSCMRYIEDNPVRAGLAREPGAWRWSSFAANALGREDPVVTPHGVYCALGHTPEERRRRYRAMFLGGSASARGF